MARLLVLTATTLLALTLALPTRRTILDRVRIILKHNMITQDGCEEGQVRCLTTQIYDGDRDDPGCILEGRVCDGWYDCEDGSDEKQPICALTNIYGDCLSSEFMCVTTGECIPNSFYCDGEPDCLDASDELLDERCLKIPCDEPNDFQCLNSAVCVHVDYVCDGHNDCGNWADEQNC